MSGSFASFGSCPVLWQAQVTLLGLRVHTLYMDAPTAGATSAASYSFQAASHWLSVLPVHPTDSSKIWPQMPHDRTCTLAISWTSGLKPTRA